MAYGDYMDDANRLIVAERTEDGTELTKASHKVMAEHYSTPLFFVPSGPLLRGHAAPLCQAFRAIEEKDLTNKELSHRAEINAIGSGEPISLKLALRLERSLGLLWELIEAQQAVGDRSWDNLATQLTLLLEDPLVPVTRVLAALSLTEEGILPRMGPAQHGYRIPTLGIVPSLHAAHAERFAKIARAEKMGAAKFGTQVFGKHAIYAELTKDTRVTIHFAQMTSRLLHERLMKKKKTGRFSNKRLFELDLDHIGREALSHRQGNVVPGLDIYWLYRGGRGH